MAQTHLTIRHPRSFRTKFYENADIQVSLEGSGIDAESGAPTAVVMYRLLKGLKAKMEATKQVGEGPVEVWQRFISFSLCMICCMAIGARGEAQLQD